MAHAAWYELTSPDQLLTPCILVYPEIVRKNLVETIRIAGSVERLRPHVKTHKTPQIVKLELELGITKHKCATLFEASMLAECGAPDVLIAYPVVGPAIKKLAELMALFPKTKFRCTVDNRNSLTQLSSAMQTSQQTLDVLVDIDSGMHRTGIPAGEDAISLYAQIAATPNLTSGGLHIYDGQNHQPDESERRAAVDGLMSPIRAMISELRARGLAVPRMVCGGTPTFPMFAALKDQGIECSPGTCTLSDYNYGRNYTDMACIQPAAVLMARVISKCGINRLTLDLGYKAVSGDQPAGRRCHVLNIADAKEVGHSEEHLIIESVHASQFEIGDVVYALPAHVCPTVALHSHLHVVEQGAVVGKWSVTARDRFY
ncbi:MAG: D-TA family PLP-dependent enzyme [Pirellulaceae bacterium]|nr:D-TA family PLP-dependent enzyme [Pirellulaceae bacterium]